MIEYKTKGILNANEKNDLNRLIKYYMPMHIEPKYRKRYLPLKFDYTWMNEQGAITKRIFKSIKKDYDFKLSDEALSNIGQRAKILIGNIEKEYRFVERKFNWPAEKYGEHNTCYWNSRKHIKNYINRSGGYGICFTERSPYSGKIRGISRCLVMPYLDNTLFLFNAYGKYGLEEITRMYAEYKNLKIRKVLAITNNNDFWINNEKGFILYPPKTKPIKIAQFIVNLKEKRIEPVIYQ